MPIQDRLDGIEIVTAQCRSQRLQIGDVQRLWRSGRQCIGVVQQPYELGILELRDRADRMPDAREIVERDLMAELGQKLDEQCFGGNGTPPNMLGLLNDPDVTDTALTAAISFDAIAAAIEWLEADGATASAIFVGPAVWGDLRVAKDGDDRYQLNPDPSGDARRQLFGVPVYVTPFLSDAAIVADMSQIGVGVRDRVTLFYDSSRYAEYDQSLIRLTARFDIAVLNPEGVELLTDITI
ncbi:phage major capsid protein, HK97 family [Luteitalea pratensis]|uniref:Phage major capsid protein, HK97 family n=1 Tax=Luteitalea pratensis TaxID=1855912 RepID=A0A143PQM2_LUTPR|nr:phage major capsid protein [Luteitalea pratensis]AMY10666.1 phage major capsid protein, HK97 family [Luteitalea pratensis]